MLTNGLPTDLNFSMPANKAMVLEVAVEFPNAGGDELLGYTFSGQVTGVDGAVYTIEGVVPGEGQNVVHIHLPALAEGTYKYALAATGQAGETEAFLAGTIGVWWAAIPEQTEPIETPNSRCIVRLPEVGRGMAHWQLTERVEVAAMEAERQAFLASEWAQAAEEAANSITGNLQVKILGDVDAALKEFDTKVSDAIQVNADTNTWWIAGVDTKVQVTGDKGDKGFSPFINSQGNWVIWDAVKGTTVDSGVKAQGVDGADGSAVRRVLIDAVEDLPPLPSNEQEADRLRGIFYMVPAIEGYDVYGLLETVNGGYAWVNVGDSNAIASSVLYGLVKLGNASVNRGATVGVNADGGLATPVANTSDYGTAKISYDSRPHETNCIGLDTYGRLQVNKANLYGYGVVRLGSALNQVASIPYLLSVGAIDNAGTSDDGKMANNLLIGGALKHMRTGSGNNGWNPDTVNGADYGALAENTFYLGLHTSNSFTQDSTNGLQLRDAALNVKGGVYIGEGLNDLGTNRVLTPTQIKEGVEDMLTDYCKLADTYTKQEVDNAINEAYGDIADDVKGEIFVQLSAEQYASIQPKDGVLYLIPEE